ncbi:MAG: hypothetical protein KBC69_01235 [Candidatus Magasanikbacteria bacterium]|nr:hypothetical protein [Candidatus Magasanikbacteria bacterium]
MDRILKILAVMVLVLASIIVLCYLCTSAYLLVNCLLWGDDDPTAIEEMFSILLSLVVVFSLVAGAVTHRRDTNMKE